MFAPITSSTDPRLKLVRYSAFDTPEISAETTYAPSIDTPTKEKAWLRALLLDVKVAFGGKNKPDTFDPASTATGVTVIELPGGPPKDTDNAELDTWRAYRLDVSKSTLRDLQHKVDTSTFERSTDSILDIKPSDDVDAQYNV